MLQVQACELAFQTGSEVQHPLLDRVRQCSAAPDQAASFFLQLFHPVPHERVKVTDHAWFASTVMSMLDEMDRAAQASAAAAEDKARLKKFSSLRQRAARFLCCGGTSPTSEADSHESHDHSPAKDEIHSSKWWKVPWPAKRTHQRCRGMWQHTLMHQSTPRMVLCRLTAVRCLHTQLFKASLLASQGRRISRSLKSCLKQWQILCRVQLQMALTRRHLHFQRKQRIQELSA